MALYVGLKRWFHGLPDVIQFSRIAIGGTAQKCSLLIKSGTMTRVVPGAFADVVIARNTPVPLERNKPAAETSPHTRWHEVRVKVLRASDS